MCAIALTKWVAVPLIRRQPIPWDGLMVMAFLTMIWQNYLLNWFRTWSTYNAIFVNRGSWYNNVMFWSAPNVRQGFAEAPFYDFGFYAAWGLSLVWLCFIMRFAKRRWPNLGKAGLFGLLLAFCMVFDFVIECLLMRGGAYTYAGIKPGWWLLFKGHYYQFPLYEIPLFGVCLASMVVVRYFRNDRGESIAERQIDEVRVGRRSKTFIRFLAIAGIFNGIFFLYNLAVQPFVIGNGGEWPADIQKRSYFTQGICGGKTDRACAGPNVPIAIPGSAYMNREGGLSYPPGWVEPALKVPFAEK
jgi:hypothetical protein